MGANERDYRENRQLLKVNWDSEVFSNSPQAKGEQEPAWEKPWDSESLIQLPAPQETVLANRDITEVIAGRKTIRKLAGGEIGLDKLSYLLWATQGMRKEKNGRVFRTVPSGGCRHPLDTYIYAAQVEGLEMGIYRYVVSCHGLVPVRLGQDVAELASSALRNQLFGSAVALFWVAVPARSEWRYSSQATKLVALDAGHVAQSGYLAAGALGLGCCVIGAYEQQQADSLLGLDGQEEFMLYAGVFGVPTPGKETV